ncbi:ribose-phosphate pyrophosphokinase [Thiohalobacter sp. IOR34]|uniref:ribose-phosphate diphosphokinase n=1 Tax=Thiohalobacter sp. IOR34 TaxID=3057176 RepID=UPI0025AED3E5|nr:ribose-phosphate pyrophosphokinase [Thiohalobacter sp. IOR34]WJW76568.1 ribose-phosphate pyrophosphokinase [Thiohalobacter sp. IOR34]
MSQGALRLFALEASRDYGRAVARHLGIDLGLHEERGFEDGEHKARPLESVRGADVFVIASLHGDERFSVNDKLVRLLFFLGALRDAAAGRLTAVVPYLCYARKDRKTKSRDPVTTRYVAALFEAVGVDGVMTLDVHNLAAFQNAFRCRTEHLEARPLFVEHFAAQVGDAPLVCVSPDVGGIKRAERFRESLSRRLGRAVDSAFMEKKRSAGVVSGTALVGEVAGRTAIIIDDMIAGGTTLARTVEACRAGGAARILAAATHGLFVGDVGHKLALPALEQLVITDSVVPFRLAGTPAAERLVVLDSARLVAEAIHRMHEGGSLVELMAD